MTPTMTETGIPAILPLDGTHLPDRELVGGKAWSITRMRNLGLRVPPAFVIPIPQCRSYLDRGAELDDAAWNGVRHGIAHLERQTGRRFGDSEAPLLVSVRSGAAVSMPGMMDTVLNLGMTDAIQSSLARESGNAQYAADTRARFCHAFGEIVLKADLDPYVAGLSVEDVTRQVLEDTGRGVPEDPYDQLRQAICAVFDSWQSARAKAYRRHWGIADNGGTAVTIQAMVFGNLDDRSGTGVLFTRDPLSGEPRPYGEWLPRGQGDDVVGGTHAVLSLDRMRDHMPDAVAELLTWAQTLERENADVQDIEFTVESGTVYLLQARAAKRAPAAAIRIAVDLVDEGLVDQAQALDRITPEQVRSVLTPRLADEVAAGAVVVATGEPACPGVARGTAVQDPDEAVRRSEAGEDVVLVRPTTSPDDVHGMIAAVAVVTDLGGATSHAAVVTRALGRPSVVGAGTGVAATLEGRRVTVDGRTGRVYEGTLPLVETRIEEDALLSRVAGWAAEMSPIPVVDELPTSDEVVDLDVVVAGLAQHADPVPGEVLVDALTGALAARGAVFTSEQGVRAAQACGVTIVADCPLLVQLVALRTLGSR